MIGSRRRPPSSLTSRPPPPPPPPPMENDDILREILLRLPPQPSSLPRASLVCKRWRRLVSDPGFLRRFRAHHGKPPLLGFFVGRYGEASFIPMLGPPDRIPTARFSLPQSRDGHWAVVGCRHGLVLFLNDKRFEAAVWDPVTGDQRRVPFPPDLQGEFVVRRPFPWEIPEKSVHHGAVLRAADGDGGHVHGDCPFKLVLVYSMIVGDGIAALACLYESESGVWGDVFTTGITHACDLTRPSILVGNAFYWSLLGGSILEFDLDMQSLDVIEKPADARVTNHSCFQVLRTEDSGLGLAILSEMSMQLWERKANSYGVVGWVLCRTVKLDRILRLQTWTSRPPIEIVGFDEDANVIFVWTNNCVFMIQLESMQFRNLFERNFATRFYPYRSFYAAGRVIDGGDDGPALCNT